VVKTKPILLPQEARDGRLTCSTSPADPANVPQPFRQYVTFKRVSCHLCTISSSQLRAYPRIAVQTVFQSLLFFAMWCVEVCARRNNKNVGTSVTASPTNWGGCYSGSCYARAVRSTGVIGRRLASIDERCASKKGGSESRSPRVATSSSTAKPGPSVAISNNTPPGSRK
jgi:hypothetical protein